MKKILRTLLTVAMVMGAFTLAAFAEEQDGLLIAPAPGDAPAVISPAPTSQPLPFTDVNEDTDFLDAIQFVYDGGVMIGTSDTEFSPTEPLTRAMLVTILYRYEGEPAFMNDLVFDDVVPGSYYEKAVVWAQGKGIVNGVELTKFAPNDNITREQLSAILFRYANYKELPIVEASADTNTLSFNDFMNISEYASPAVHCCLATGILTPRGMDILPRADATRAEAAQGIYGLANLVSGEAPAQLSYADLAGEYQDSFSGRAALIACEGENDLQIVIWWANSAFEYVQWTMTAAYGEDGTLSYQDCEKALITTDENGVETTEPLALDVEKSGYFSLCDGVLMWDGAAEENCQSCTFEKVAAE